MNIRTLKTNTELLLFNYILLLTKSEKLHAKLERLLFIRGFKKVFFNKRIQIINNQLNILLSDIMVYQNLIEVKCA